MPQLPTITVVTPWLILGRASGAESTIRSSWVCTSMNPGATTLPATSMTWAPSLASPGSIATIRPSSMRTSASNRSAPVPSITVPPRSSNGSCVWSAPTSSPSEVSADRSGHAIVVVDGEHQTPLVERGARVRDAAADEITDTHIRVRRDAQVGMLVVQGRHLDVIVDRTRTRVPALSELPLRSRHLEIEGHVTLAHG